MAHYFCTFLLEVLLLKMFTLHLKVHAIIRQGLSFVSLLHAFMSSADFLSKSSFPKNNFRNTVRVSSSLDTDQARRFVGPDLGLNCLQRLSADDAGRQRNEIINLRRN